MAEPKHSDPMGRVYLTWRHANPDHIFSDKIRNRFTITMVDAEGLEPPTPSV